MTSTATARPPASGAAADALRALISERPYRSGDRLPPERDLCLRLGVSRPTLREAISRLVHEGMLVARHGSGTFIAPVDLDHVFAVRLQLEPLAAACAAKSRTSRDADLLEQLVHDLRAALDDSPRFAEIDTQIHDTVSSASGNPVLRDVLERLNGLAKLSRELTAVDREVRGQTLVDLGQLATAIRRKDSELAGESMRAHIDHVFAALPGRST